MTSASFGRLRHSMLISTRSLDDVQFLGGFFIPNRVLATAIYRHRAE